VRVWLVSLNVAILLTIGFFALRATQAERTINQSVPATGVQSQNASEPLDKLSSADIAVAAARATGLPESLAVKNQADSVAAELTVAPADTTVVAKPQSVATAFKSRKDIKAYTVVAGDTVATIAAKFNVTSDSVIWSNGLSGNTVKVGAVLAIPPVNGIVYKVIGGDTVDNLAQKYRANRDQIVAYNDIELSGLQVGEQILIPNGQQPAPVVDGRFVIQVAAAVAEGVRGHVDDAHDLNGGPGHGVWSVLAQRPGPAPMSAIMMLPSSPATNVGPFRFRGSAAA